MIGYEELIKGLKYVNFIFLFLLSLRIFYDLLTHQILLEIFKLQQPFFYKNNKTTKSLNNDQVREHHTSSQQRSIINEDRVQQNPTNG